MRQPSRFFARTTRLKGLAFALLAVSIASILPASAENLDDVTRLIMPAPYELEATGTGPQELTITWKDVDRIEQAYELQWTKDPTDPASWAPATETPIDHSKCSGDNTGQLPYVNANDQNSDYLNPYNDPQPILCSIGLNKLRNRSNNADEPLPYADPATNVRWFRIRGIFPYKLPIPGVPGNRSIDFPKQVQGLLHSPWSGIDPAILGPLQPINLQVFPSFPSLTLTWVNQATGDPAFTKNRVDRAQGPIFQQTELPASQTSYLDGPLAWNTTYSYRVIAKREVTINKPADPNTGAAANPSHVESGFSPSHGANLGLAITTPPIPAPGDPSNLIATFAAPATSHLQWIDNATDEDGFLIEFGNDGTNWVAQTAVGPHNSPATGPTTAMQVAIPPDTVRYYRVFAYRVSPYAKSNPSNTAMIIAIPRAPSNLVETAVTSFSSVLQWKDNSNIETGYRIEYCNPSSFSCASPGTAGWATAGTAAPAGGTGSLLTFTDGRFASSTLKYRVVAFNGSGDSAPSSVLTSTTPAGPLTTPLNLTATPAGPHQINVAWLDTIDDKGYLLEFSDSGSGGPFTQLATTGLNVTTYADAPLPGGKSRCYRVRGIDVPANRRSNPSNVACATTPMGPIPAAPTNAVAVPWSVNPTMAVEFTWQDNATNEDGFIIERSANNQTWVQVGRTLPNITVFRIGNYDPNSTQYFRVKAYNYEGESAYSNVAQVLLLGPPRPVWTNPSKDNTVSTSQCYVEGSYAHTFSPAINDIQIVIVRKLGADVGTYSCNTTPGSCTNQGGLVPITSEPATNQVQLNWNGPGTFRLEFHFLKNVTYELHARTINVHGASADAFIASFAVVADCPLG